MTVTYKLLTRRLYTNILPSVRGVSVNAGVSVSVKQRESGVLGVSSVLRLYQLRRPENKV